MGLLGKLAQFLRKKHHVNFEQATFHPEEEQLKKLLDIMEKQENTEFGKKYQFNKIKTVKEFQKTLEIQKYQDLKPYIDRMVSGEKNILTFDEPTCYGITGGSEGEPKATPITPTYKNEYQSVLHCFLYHIYNDHPKSFDGKVLYFNGSGDMGQTPTGVPYGQMSGFNFKNLPKILQKFYAVPYEITIIEDFYSKYYCAVLLSLVQNITMMMAITGGPIIVFMNTLQSNVESLINDLNTGTLNKELKLTLKEREVVEKLHKQNKKVARILKHSLEKNNGQINPFDIWPNIDLLVCWKSSTAGSYLPKLKEIFQNKIPIRDAIYSATEGWCNVPYSDDVIGGPLAITAHFYEFIDISDTDENVLLTHQLEIGKKYKIFYTTNSGMYRYDIGDILEVTGMYNKTPCVKFVGKSSRISNIAGEKLTEYHISKAVDSIAEKNEITIPFYCMVPDATSYPPKYNLLMELPEEKLDSNEVEDIVKQIENIIFEQNWEYKLHRNNGNLGNIKAILLEKGSMNIFRGEEVKRLGNDSQVKPLILAEDMSRLNYLKTIKEVAL